MRDFQEDYDDSLPTTQIIAKYKNGKFIDNETNKEVVLVEDSLVKIFTNLNAIRKEDYERHISESRKEIFSKGTILHMKLPIDSFNYYILKIELGEPLFMKKRGNKNSLCEHCKFTIIEVWNNKNEIIEFEPITARSLNQIFFLSSIQFRKNNRSHTANIYKCTYTSKGEYLEDFRF